MIHTPAGLQCLNVTTYTMKRIIFAMKLFIARPRLTGPSHAQSSRFRSGRYGGVPRGPAALLWLRGCSGLPLDKIDLANLLPHSFITLFGRHASGVHFVTKGLPYGRLVCRTLHYPTRWLLLSKIYRPFPHHSPNKINSTPKVDISPLKSIPRMNTSLLRPSSLCSPYPSRPRRTRPVISMSDRQATNRSRTLLPWLR